MARRTTVALLLTFLALGFGALTLAVLRTNPLLAQTSGDQFAIEKTPNVMVTARDGVRLATDVYLPKRNGNVTGPFPTLVERTPYNKETTAAAVVQYFVPRGYAVVYQDIRGRYRSEGKWRALQDDGPDGADLLKWIVAQPWSNRKVGTVGTSYAGATQHAIAITNAPGLAAMAPVDAMSDMADSASATTAPSNYAG
jgi:putative CocE/NonD family hydrolase